MFKNTIRQTFPIAYASDNHIYGNSDRFFYKMDGVDPDWVDAGNRREVFYSNLAIPVTTF